MVTTETEQLNEARINAQKAAEKAEGDLPRVLKTWWEQPAIDCAPWIEGTFHFSTCFCFGH